MKPLHSPLGTWAASWLGVVAEALRVAEKTTGPVVDLIIRLALAQAFLVSALIKITNWDNAVYLSANEYPVAWLAPVPAAYLGVAVELFGSVLLAAGLA
ncbi:MAG: DoxX family membrane protein, partial [Burkholderiales bacterium]|nr:DoxX family membrane protein [Burkholderiales bacterium]